MSDLPKPEEKENHLDTNENTQQTSKQSSNFFASSKRNFPVSSLSDDEEEEESAEETSPEPMKRVKTTNSPVFGSKAVVVESKAVAVRESVDKVTLPVLRILPSLGGGREVRFPITPRATVLDLKDFILFELSIPHFQQVISFKSTVNDQRIKMSSFPEGTLLAEIPGLIDEITGYSAPLSLAFKMNSGMDFTPYASAEDLEEAASSSNSSSAFEFDSADTGPGNELAASIAKLIPLPPGTPANARVLVRSVSRASASNSNMPTLWEVFLPETNIKMLISAVINIEHKQKPGDNLMESAKESVKESVKESTVPKIVITPPEEEETVQVADELNSLKLSPQKVAQEEPKPYCDKCKIRCRPALRFICKCGATFCQSHRYPDQHSCTFDHRAAGVARIQASNPKIVKEKVENF